MNEQSHPPSLFIGIDWADEKHDCYVIDRDGEGFHREISHTPDDIDAWVGEMLQLADGKPIAIMRTISWTTYPRSNVQGQRAAVPNQPKAVGPLS